MAGEMKRFGIPVLVVILAASCAACSGSEEGSGTSVALDLGDQGGEVGQIPVAPQPEVVDPNPNQATPQPASTAPTGASAESMLMLDSWHRARANDRAGVADGNGKDAEALREFSKIWSGGAAAYQARLGVAPVTVFGREFEAYSKALARDGTAGLERALKGGNNNGPAFLAWTEALIQMALNQQNLPLAGESTGRLLTSMLAAGYDRERVLELETVATSLAAQVSTFLPAEDYTVQPNDSYWVICRKFQKQGIDAYQGWIMDFNGKTKSGLREDERLRIPTAKLKLVAWRQARLAVLFADGAPIRVYPISCGTSDAPTPLGDFTLDILLEKPMWYPPEGGAIPYGNLKNPLGERWLGFEEDKSYAFHGTNSEETIGSIESHGCIRMHNADVIELYSLVGKGLAVTINA